MSSKLRMEFFFHFCLTAFLLEMISVNGHENRDAADRAEDSQVDEDLEVASDQKLLIISLDGFRYDFLDRDGLENFKSFWSTGVRAKSMYSSYITKTFPNHYTIATGLYEEAHGIVGNHMWDPVWNENFTKCSDAICSKWYSGVPMWQAKNIGSGSVSSGVIYWPGCNDEVNSPTHFIPYTSNPTVALNFTVRIDEMLKWFTDRSKPINLGMIYYEQPDGQCHSTGPDSEEVNKILQEIDKHIGYLIKRLQSINLELNVIILSDHGFANIDGDPIFLEDWVDVSTFNIVDNNPILGIWPLRTEQENDIYTNLSRCPGLLVYRNTSTELQHYHYSANRRIAPIVISTKRSDDQKSARHIFRVHQTGLDEKGDHGWNNSWDSMHALFIARGPAFKQNYRRGSFENVNVYPLVCKILNLNCTANNGSLDLVKDMLREPQPQMSQNTMVTLILVFMFCALIGGGVLVMIWRNRKAATSVLSGDAPPQSRMPFRASERSTLLSESDDDEF